MSFYSYKNANADQCPGSIVGGAMQGVTERICVQVKNVLDACIGGQFDPCVARSRQHFQIVRRSGRLGRRVADWPALHEDDWLLTIAADRRRRQAQHLFGLGPFQDRIE